MDISRSLSDGDPPRLALWWLLLGLVALLASSLFAVILILLRTLHLAQWLGGPQFFSTAIVLHVNLSVLVWFLSFAGLLWSLVGGKRWVRVGQLAWVLAALGTTAILLSPWFVNALSPTDPVNTLAVMSNYLPILRTPLFLVGLTLFGCGVLLLTLRTSLVLWPWSDPAGPPHRVGLLVAAIALLLALVALLHATWMLRTEQHSAAFYEALFWGVGHLLQFVHTFLMLTVWLWLAARSGLSMPLSNKVIAIGFGLGLLPALFSPLFFLEWHPYSSAYRLYFTQLMSYASWLVAPVIGLPLLWQWSRHPSTEQTTPEQRVFRSYLWFSLFLFMLGLLIGSQIEGDSVMVTAHYHGTVGAITVAYMGITFHLLALFGFRRTMNGFNRLQPYLYGGGLTLLILGLGWLGLHNMPRKIPFSLYAPATWDMTVGVTLLGLGGGIGLVGAFLFLVLAFLTLRDRGKKE